MTRRQRQQAVRQLQRALEVFEPCTDADLRAWRVVELMADRLEAGDDPDVALAKAEKVWRL
jgi:hypothetical protein